MNDKLLKMFRQWRIVSMILTVFVLFWGWDVYQFVNANIDKMTTETLAFYAIIIGLVGWVIKNWMTTKAVDKDV